MSLLGKVCLVTGASRGIGKGISLVLGSAGATVYFTGRTQRDLNVVSEEIRKRGGIPKPIVMDHSQDSQIQLLFERIAQENNGRLDCCVNNAYSGVSSIFDNTDKGFWETDPVVMWDSINGVGLRNHYLCTTYASRLMVTNKSGLIVNISSYAGLQYIFNCAYGIGKAATDRMAADCAVELKKHNVAMVSLWPGAVKTEEVITRFLDNPKLSAKEKELYMDNESVEFPGLAIRHLMTDPKIMSKTGKILLTRKLAAEYKFTDGNGTIPGDICEVKSILKFFNFPFLASLTPSFIKIPLICMHMASNKF